MPRLDQVQPPPFRATNSSQNGLLLVQHVGGNRAGSLSTWQTAALRPPKSTVRYSTPDCWRTCSPVRLAPLNETHLLIVDPSPCSTTSATWWLPLAASHVAAGLDQAMAVIGTWTAAATSAARMTGRRLSVTGASTRFGG